MVVTGTSSGPPFVSERYFLFEIITFYGPMHACGACESGYGRFAPVPLIANILRIVLSHSFNCLKINFNLGRQSLKINFL
jgi:hypothetical protein